MTPNSDLARYNMIVNQVRTWGVTDRAVLTTLGAVQRDRFVPETFRPMAFFDMTIPLGHGEVMMKPVVEGRLLQALALTGSERVLEIGTGSGYLTACLATMARHVTSVDLHEDFVSSARTTLNDVGVDNVTLRCGDAVKDFEPAERYDAVVVTGAVPGVSQRFLSWVQAGGRAFMIHGHSPAMHAVLLHHEGREQFRTESLFETDLPWLVHATPDIAFTL